MQPLKQPVRPIARFIRRGDTPDMSVEHSLFVLLDPHHSPAFPSLDHDLYLAVLLTLSLQNTPEGADLEYLLRVRFVNRGVMLRSQKDLPLAGHGLFECHHGTGPADLKCDLCVRKNNDVPNGNHRKTFDIRRHLICKFLHTQWKKFTSMFT